MKKNRNTIQDVSIARLDERIKSLEKRLDKFISNEFMHLVRKVDKVLWVMIGLLVSIITLLFSRFMELYIK